MRIVGPDLQASSASPRKGSRAPLIEGIAAVIRNGLEEHRDGAPRLAGTSGPGAIGSAAHGASAGYLAQAIGQLWGNEGAAHVSDRAAAAYDRADMIAGIAVSAALPGARLSV